MSLKGTENMHARLAITRELSSIGIPPFADDMGQQPSAKAFDFVCAVSAE